MHENVFFNFALNHFWFESFWVRDNRNIWADFSIIFHICQHFTNVPTKSITGELQGPGSPFMNIFEMVCSILSI
jgi:hypothetical protein